MLRVVPASRAAGQADRRTGRRLSVLFRFERIRTGSPVELDRGERIEQFLEEHLALEPGQVHAEAEVAADPEATDAGSGCDGCRSSAGRETPSSSRLADV